MPGFQISLTGDAELQDKLADLADGITGWMMNDAFKPAALMFRNPTIANIRPLKRRLGSTKTMKTRAMRRSRVMKGVQLTSQFGTTNVQNDPYYGAFVHWGHKIYNSSRQVVGKTKPVLHAKRAFEAYKSRAANEAATNLRDLIEKAWGKQQHSTPIRGLTKGGKIPGMQGR
jgi:hypothetical protein